MPRGNGASGVTSRLEPPSAQQVIGAECGSTTPRKNCTMRGGNVGSIAGLDATRFGILCGYYEMAGFLGGNR